MTRALIMNALETAFKGITQSNGYHNDIGTVQKEFAHDTAVAARGHLPAVLLNYHSFTRADGPTHYAELQEVEEQLNIAATCILKATDTKDINTAISDMIEDVERLIALNPRLTDYVSDTLLRSGRIEDAETRPYVFVQCVIQFTLTRRKYNME